jgi:hypothetical protein
MSVLNGDATIDVIALRGGLEARQFAEALSRLTDRELVALVPLGSADAQTSASY